MIEVGQVRGSAKCVFDRLIELGFELLIFGPVERGEIAGQVPGAGGFGKIGHGEIRG